MTKVVTVAPFPWSHDWHFESLATSLRLWPVTESCGSEIVIYELSEPVSNKQHHLGKPCSPITT